MGLRCIPWQSLLVNANVGYSSAAVNTSTTVLKITEKLKRDLLITKPGKRNKFGVIRPIGMTTTDANGDVYWRDNNRVAWSKHSVNSSIF